MARRTSREYRASESAVWTALGRMAKAAWGKHCRRIALAGVLGASKMNPRNFFAEPKRRNPRFQTLLKRSIAAAKDTAR
jgi:hypothetical protein